VKTTQGHYKEKLENCKCWRADKTCSLGKEFLEQLYSWSELNPLHPMLVRKVCDPCQYENKLPEWAKENEQNKSIVGTNTKAQRET
jgi:hypothetical protein